MRSVLRCFRWRADRSPSPLWGGVRGGAVLPSRSRVTAITAVAVSLAVAACSTGNFQPVRPIAVAAGRTAGMISSYRAQHGLGPVSVDSALMQAAANYARSMGERDKINHRIGGTLAKRVSAAGYDWGAT